MTMCNMAVEGGARAAIMAPDEKVFAYLEDKPRAPQGKMLETARGHWNNLYSDPDAVFDAETRIDVAGIEPQVTWGTSPDQCCAVSAKIPDPKNIKNPSDRAAAERALAYIGLTPGMPMTDVAINTAFIGSCTNSRIEDLRVAAHVVSGRHVAPGVKGIVVPGSLAVRRQAEAEGLSEIFKAAGFEWRNSGCSMCLAMNDDVLGAGDRCASSTNRNFEGRQGRHARTHLMSPAMVAAAAVTGHICDFRLLSKETAYATI